MTSLERTVEKRRLMRKKYDLLAAVTDPSLDQMNEMLELHSDIDKLDKLIEKLQLRDSFSDDDKKAAAQQASGLIVRLVEDNNIHFTATSNLWWWQNDAQWHNAKPPGFFEKFRSHIDGDGYMLFQAIMDRQKRKVNAACYAWVDRPGYLNLLSMSAFCPMNMVAETYHPVFDLLFRSLGGDKPENKEHLEKLILAKWQHPQEFLLPCVVFADQGGTGKSLLITAFLTTAFGADNVADNLSIEQAFGKFNKSVAGKAIVFANEAPEDQGENKNILRVIHSPMISIEAKGKDPIPSVNTALYFIGTNPKAGGYAIKLAFSDVDRRFSIMHGGQPLKAYVSEYYDLPTEDDYAAGHDKMTGELQHILRDPTEVGKWFGCMQKKYGDVRNLRALHGKDYSKQATDTVELHTRVFDAVFKAEDFHHIRSEVLFQLYKDNGGLYKNIGFHRLACVYLEDHPELGTTYEKDYPWNDNRRKKARVYIKNAPKHRDRLDNNDYVWGNQTESGRWFWHIDVV